MRHPLAIAAILLVAVMSAACPAAGARVDSFALFEPAQLMWPDVRDDLEAGYVDGVTSGDITETAADTLRTRSVELEDALRIKSRDDLRLVPWSTMKPWAERGIDAQLTAETIGPGVAASFLEHVSNFDEILVRLRGLAP